MATPVSPISYLFGGGKSDQNPFLPGLSSAASGNFQGPGGTDIGLSSNYFKTLLGGNPQALAQATAPMANSLTAQADAQKRELAQRGDRTGATAAAMQQTEDKKREAIANALFQGQSTAAGSLATIGQGELQTMMDALGMGAQISQSDINSRRAATTAMWTALIKGAGDVAGAAIA